MRRPSREVELEDVVWQGILNGQDDAVDVVLKLHLALEALLIEIIKLHDEEAKPWCWSFPKKLNFLLESNYVTEHDVRAFSLVNDLRNDVSHIFGYKLDVESALNVASSLEREGIDFSDSPANYDVDQAVEYFDGLRGILAEIGWNVLSHAAWILSDAGGRDIFSE